MKLQDILLESDEQQLAQAFASELEKELQDDGQLNEALTAVGILSWALASNTVLDILGKYAAKGLRKLNLNKAADKADAIHKWAHHNEQNFIKLLGGVIKPFVKDPAKREIVAKGLFIAILAGLGVKAGVGALKAIRGAQMGAASLSAVKGALKGRDIANVAQEIMAGL